MDIGALARKLSPSGSLAEAWYEYDRRIDAFKATPIGQKLWMDWDELSLRATGLTVYEYRALDSAYWAWKDSQIDHAALERDEQAHREQALAGPQICGHCSGTFSSIAALMSHSGFCSFKARAPRPLLVSRSAPMIGP
jgi:hypothetical protein